MQQITTPARSSVDYPVITSDQQSKNNIMSTPSPSTSPIHILWDTNHGWTQDCCRYYRDIRKRIGLCYIEACEITKSQLPHSFASHHWSGDFNILRDLRIRSKSVPNSTSATPNPWIFVLFILAVGYDSILVVWGVHVQSDCNIYRAIYIYSSPYVASCKFYAKENHHACLLLLGDWTALSIHILCITNRLQWWQLWLEWVQRRGSYHDGCLALLLGLFHALFDYGVLLYTNMSRSHRTG